MRSPTLPVISLWEFDNMDEAILPDSPHSDYAPWDDTIGSNTPESEFSYSQRRQTVTNLKSLLVPTKSLLKNTLSKAIPFLSWKQSTDGRGQCITVKRQTPHAIEHNDVLEITPLQPAEESSSTPSPSQPTGIGLTETGIPELLNDSIFHSRPPHFVAPELSGADITLILRAARPASPDMLRDLGSFRRFSSASEDPKRWLAANHHDVLECISKSTRLNQSQRAECSEWTRSLPLCQRLLVLVYDILSISMLTRLSVSFLHHVWRLRDSVSSVSHHQAIVDRLVSFIPSSFDDSPALKKILALDLDALCIQLSFSLKDDEQYRQLISLKGDDAQSLLDLLQTILDYRWLDILFRSPFMNALLRLSRKSGLYPKSLRQQDVELQGNDPVTAGQFGDVWIGRYEDRQVAVKVLKLYLRSDLSKHLKNVLHETLIWRQLQHKNILPFLCLHCVNNDSSRIALVSPWMGNGNVRDFLIRFPATPRLPLVTDIVEGLCYLHSMQPSIVHGDLKAVNILITDARRACLADFGLSTASQSQVLQLSSFSDARVGGTSRWTAPELLDGTQETNTTKSDIYALGCVCYEMFSGSIPFHDIVSDYPVILKVIRGERPVRPSHYGPTKLPCDTLGLDNIMWGIVEKCWKADAKDRLTASQISGLMLLRSIV